MNRLMWLLPTFVHDGLFRLAGRRIYRVVVKATWLSDTHCIVHEARYGWFRG